MANQREWADKIEDAVIEQLLNLGWTRTSYRSFVNGAYRVSLNSSNKQATIKILHILEDRSLKTLSITKVESNKNVISINNSISSPKQTNTLVLEPFQVKVDVKTNLVDLSRQVVVNSVLPILTHNIIVSNVPRYEPSKERLIYNRVSDLIVERFTRQGYEIVYDDTVYMDNTVIFNSSITLDRLNPYFSNFLAMEKEHYYVIETENDELRFRNCIPDSMSDDRVLKIEGNKYRITDPNLRGLGVVSGGLIPDDLNELVNSLTRYLK